MEDEIQQGVRQDLLSEISDVGLMRHLLADLHDDLQGKIARFKFLFDLGVQLGTYRTMLFGGHLTYNAYVEARSSFVHGNYVATVLLCQSLVENLLAGFLHGGLMDELPPRIQFDETLRRCRVKELLTDDDVTDLRKLVSLRNPLTHFRSVNDQQNLDRRSIATGRLAGEILSQDAWFAISVATRMLAKEPFRLG
jgi:hypothetical protein